MLPLFSPLCLGVVNKRAFNFMSAIPGCMSLFCDSKGCFVLAFLLFVFDFRVLGKVCAATEQGKCLVIKIFLVALLFDFLRLLLCTYLFVPRGI